MLVTINKQDAAREQIIGKGLFPLFCHDEVDVRVSVVKSCKDVGVGTIKFINKGDKAFENFKKQ